MEKIISNIFICFISFFLLISYVFAEECTNEEISKLKVMANDIEVTFDNGGVCDNLFNIQFINITNDFYIYDTTHGYLYSYLNVEDNTYSFIANKSGKYKFDIYSEKCDIKVNSLSINVFDENKYASDELCNNSDLDICKIDYDTCNMSYEEFKKNFTAEEEIINDIEKKDDYNNIIMFFEKYYLFVIGVVVLFFVAICLFFIKKKKDSVLE